MKTRITKFITRRNCPETNSSSSHSFIFSREVFKEEDLLLSTQTITLAITPSGKKIAEFDGNRDDYSIAYRVNDSKSKALYALGSARLNYGVEKGKKKLEEVKKVIKETLNLDEVIVKHWKSIDIDYQSHDCLKLILDEGYEAIKEFIFNPRVWLFILWDSEDYYENPIYDVHKGIFNYEVSIKFPIKVEKFLEKTEIQEIEFTKPSRDYPSAETIYDIFQDIVCENKIDSYSSTNNHMNRGDYQRRYFMSSETTENNPEIFEYLTITGIENDLYVMYVNSSLWEKMLDNIKKYEYENKKDNINKVEEELKTLEEYWKGNKDMAFNKYIVKRLLNERCGFLTKSEINDYLGLSENDFKLFKITIYSRETNGEL